MPAFFVHGVPDTSALWDGVRANIERDDVIAPNLPGFGAPVPDGFGATKEEYVDWVIAEIEKVGEPVDIVGHDWGSLLVQRAVSLRPEFIRTWAAGAGTVDREYVWHDLAQDVADARGRRAGHGGDDRATRSSTRSPNRSAARRRRPRWPRTSTPR